MVGIGIECNFANIYLFTVVDCNVPWNYVDDEDCLGKALVNNEWATPEDVEDLPENEKKSLLIEKMVLSYDGQIHSQLDLSMRAVTGDKGSLCGLAAMYQAAFLTVLTKSQLKQMSFNDVKVLIGEILGLDETTAKKTKDMEILALYNQG